MKTSTVASTSATVSTNNDPSITTKSVPPRQDSEVTDSVTEEDEDDQDDLSEAAETYDEFDASKVPMPRIESGSNLFVLEIAPRNGGFSNDPLFQANTLYEGEMSTEQVETYCSKTILGTSPSDSSTSSMGGRPSSWTNSVFRYFSNN
ncbi:MAG: hypothetical protein SGARI_004315, partial [Bacillariaceae sp.]